MHAPKAKPKRSEVKRSEAMRSNAKQGKAKQSKAKQSKAHTHVRVCSSVHTRRYDSIWAKRPRPSSDDGCCIAWRSTLVRAVDLVIHATPPPPSLPPIGISVVFMRCLLHRQCPCCLCMRAVAHAGRPCTGMHTRAACSRLQCICACA